MKLIISNSYSQDFINNYIPSVIKKLFDSNCNKPRLKRLAQELDLNVLGIIYLSIRTLNISKINNSYVISINKRIKIKNDTLENVINTITYGSRSVKGYPILLDIFNYISKNVDQLYERWLDGDTILW